MYSTVARSGFTGSFDSFECTSSLHEGSCIVELVGRLVLCIAVWSHGVAMAWPWQEAGLQVSHHGTGWQMCNHLDLCKHWLSLPSSSPHPADNANPLHNQLAPISAAAAERARYAVSDQGTLLGRRKANACVHPMHCPHTTQRELLMASECQLQRAKSLCVCVCAGQTASVATLCMRPLSSLTCPLEA